VSGCYYDYNISRARPIKTLKRKENISVRVRGQCEVGKQESGHRRAAKSEGERSGRSARPRKLEREVAGIIAGNPLPLVSRDDASLLARIRLRD
jgi:hypothetical protein